MNIYIYIYLAQGHSLTVSLIALYKQIGCLNILRDDKTYIIKHLPIIQKALLYITFSRSTLVRLILPIKCQARWLRGEETLSH
jgi:hypothetical protein